MFVWCESKILSRDPEQLPSWQNFQSRFAAINLKILIIEPPHDKTHKITCVLSEDSDPPSVIRVSLSTWRNIGALTTYWAHSESSDQTDLSLHWVHISFC